MSKLEKCGESTTPKKYFPLIINKNIWTKHESFALLVDHLHNSFREVIHLYLLFLLNRNPSFSYKAMQVRKWSWKWLVSAAGVWVGVKSCRNVMWSQRKRARLNGHQADLTTGEQGRLKRQGDRIRHGVPSGCKMSFKCIFCFFLPKTLTCIYTKQKGCKKNNNVV